MGLRCKIKSAKLQKLQINGLNRINQGINVSTNESDPLRTNHIPDETCRTLTTRAAVLSNTINFNTNKSLQKNTVYTSSCRKKTVCENPAKNIDILTNLCVLCLVTNVYITAYLAEKRKNARTFSSEHRHVDLDCLQLMSEPDTHPEAIL